MAQKGKLTKDEIQALCLDYTLFQDSNEELGKNYDISQKSVSHYLNKGIKEELINRENYTEAISRRRSQSLKENHPRKGIPMSDEQKTKIKDSLKKRYQTQEHHSKGTTRTDDEKEKISKGLRQRYQTQEHHLKGKQLSKDHKEKLRKLSSKPRKYLDELIHSLADDYVYFDDSIEELAKNYEITSKTMIPRLMNKAVEKGFITREQYESAESRKRSQNATGEHNANFNNWSSLLPYSPEFDKLAPEIRERDNHTCQVCDKKEKENGRALDVHHIDYNKDNNDPTNLISLCLECHSPTSGANKTTRKVWTELFQEMIEEIYLAKC
jgi:hypothetical protein